MTEGDVATALRDALLLVLKLGGPLLLAALAVGLAVSLLQAITQVNEPTLVFLPKLLVLGGGAALLAPYMVAQLSAYAQSLMDRLVQAGSP